MCLLVLIPPITFACWDEGSDPPQQLGHHPSKSPVEKCSTWRIRLVRYVGNHARDQRDARLLTHKRWAYEENRRAHSRSGVPHSSSSPHHLHSCHLPPLN